MSIAILKVKIKYEHDIVLARQRTRCISEQLGFDQHDQVRCATAVSEIARNVYQYAGGGDVEYFVEGQVPPQVFIIKISDRGPGISNLNEIMEGRYRSKSGLGLGILGAKRLMEVFHIESKPGEGTVLVMGRPLPDSAPPINADRILKIVDYIARQRPQEPFSELQQQNQELIQALDELRQRKEDLEMLNQELGDTNRGMVALYAELDEKAANLRRANDLKARFLSNMSHEFRTPLNSITAIARLLTDRTDGDLNAEQEKQVVFIQKAAEDLGALVNDLLDLAKIEAGKLTVHVSEFTVAELLSGLRGLLRPLNVNSAVKLQIEEPEEPIAFRSDEGKIAQILRNLVSNALKFTEQGEIRVSIRPSLDDQQAVITVADTGIGIPRENLESIFQEYGQVDIPLQRKLRGSGLGLPLSRHLAQLLGGGLSVESQLGIGSTFQMTIPLAYQEKRDDTSDQKVEEDTFRYPVLVIEDDLETQVLYEKFLKREGYQIHPAYTLKEARALLGKIKPVAIILDLLFPGENGWQYLIELKSNPLTRDIPVFVATVIKDEEKALHLGATDFCIKPVERKWLLKKLDEVAALQPIKKVLIIDDEEVSRYLLKAVFTDTSYQLLEAAGGVDGLRLAKAEHPDLILLDLVMPDLSGFEVLNELRLDDVTRDIPVFIVTSKNLEEDELKLLREKTSAVISKSAVSRELVLDQIREKMARLKAGKGREK